MPKDTLPPSEILIEQLHGTDWTARCNAARLLGQSRDPRTVDALLPDLEDKDWRVSTAIILECKEPFPSGV